MAENAAHISSAPQNNPSIFEVFAQESFMSSLQGSLKVLFDIISRKDNKYAWIIKWHEEIYLCFNCFLQYHYLKQFGGSFSEAFYNLRRAPIKDPSKLNLSTKQQMKSLLILVALPYVSDRLKVYIDKWQSGNHQIKKSSEWYRLVDTFVTYYKYFCMSYEILKLVHFVRYMTGKSVTHTPLLDLAGVRLIYQIDEVKKFPDFSWKDILLSPFRSNTDKPDFRSIIVKVLCQGLEFSAFFIQFLWWWRQSNDSRTKLNSYPVPSAPHSGVKENSFKFNGLCPICMRKRRVEVVLQTSGYVFCYKCILDNINKTGKCPITGLPSTSKDLIRVYDTLL